MTEEVQTSETSLNSYQSTRQYNPEDSHLQWCICYFKTFPRLSTSVRAFKEVDTYISSLFDISGITSGMKCSQCNSIFCHHNVVNRVAALLVACCKDLKVHLVPGDTAMYPNSL
jgi:hypothetical protein